MERLKERLAFAERAISTFDEILRGDLRNAATRDAAIKRFEYSFETT